MQSRAFELYRPGTGNLKDWLGLYCVLYFFMKPNTPIVLPHQINSSTRTSECTVIYCMLLSQVFATGSRPFLLLFQYVRGIVWMRSSITDLAWGQVDFGWFNWIYNMTQTQTSRDCSAMTASLFHIKDSFRNALWLGCLTNDGKRLNKKKWGGLVLEKYIPKTWNDRKRGLGGFGFLQVRSASCISVKSFQGNSY